MKLLMIAAAFVGVAALARWADAAESRPVVCMSYEIVRADTAVCRDGKRPVLLTVFQEVSIKDKEGGAVKALVGWR